MHRELLPAPSDQSRDRRIAWSSHTSTNSIALTVTGFLGHKQTFSIESAARSDAHSLVRIYEQAQLRRHRNGRE